MPKAKSKAQAGLLGAIIAGKNKKGKGMTKAEAKARLKGVKVSRLPKKKSGQK